MAGRPAERGIWVITDEIYEHLVYGDARFVSMPVVAPEIADRCLVLNGVAKTYAMNGWRVGWMAGPPDVIKAATNLQSHATSNVCNVAQAAAFDRASRRPVRGSRRCARVRPAAAGHDRDAERCAGRRVPAAGRRVLLLSVGRGRARQADRRAAADYVSQS